MIKIECVMGIKQLIVPQLPLEGWIWSTASFT